jgi:hypothetical protein
MLFQWLFANSNFFLFAEGELGAIISVDVQIFTFLPPGQTSGKDEYVSPHFRRLLGV